MSARDFNDREVCLATAVEFLEELPAIDDRLVISEAGYEILDGVVTFVPPADPPHGERHATVAALIGSHVHPAFKVAIDLLTRTSKIDDFAPDISVFPRAPHPVTGGRQLEHLVFEIVSTQAMSLASKKAAKLAERGVRRLFAIDLDRARVVEWSHTESEWLVLEGASVIEDPALEVPLSVAALLEIVDTDDEVARALVIRGNSVIETFGEARKAEGLADGVARGQAEAIASFLVARGFELSEPQRARILAERVRLPEWLVRAATCSSVDDLLAE